MTIPTTQPTGRPPPRPQPVRGGAGRLGLLRELERPADVFANITPNWYASIMGTGIIAVAAAGLPQQSSSLHTAAVVIWILASVLLIGLSVVTGIHWARHRATARGHLLDPVISHFYGAPPMALMTVGAATILVGRGVLGTRAAVDIDWVLWLAGTVGGLASAAVLPYVMFTRHTVQADAAFGGWLMPVVPPMVSASTGALLIPHVAARHLRLSLLMGCYAMFGMSLLASLVIITLIWHRLALHKVGEARMVPTLWIVLGPLGQSITAANLLGGVAHDALPAPYSTALQAFDVVYGVPVWGFAVLWAAIATAITVRTTREHLPFSLTWWSFTFPIGTCVTGTSSLALHTGAELFRDCAGLLFGALVAAWLLVAALTARGSIRGRIFLATSPGPHAGLDPVIAG